MRVRIPVRNPAARAQTAFAGGEARRITDKLPFNYTLAGIIRIMLPEARIILAQATTYLACAPKSNASYMAIEEVAREIVSMRDLKGHP